MAASETNTGDRAMCISRGRRCRYDGVRCRACYYVLAEARSGNENRRVPIEFGLAVVQQRPIQPDIVLATAAWVRQQNPQLQVSSGQD